MDEDVEYVFEGNAACDLCGALAGTTDSRPIPAPHENCACSSVPTCNNTYSYGGSSSRYGQGGSCFTFNASLTVTCWDGTTIEYEVPVDFGCVGADEAENFADQVFDQLADKASSMAEGCPDCAPQNVS